MVYFTSDMHFGHENVIRFCKRPFSSVEEMNSTIIRRWNSKIKPEDTVYVLGDMCFTQFSAAIPIFKQLNGKKILIQGNHDKYSVSQYEKLGFTSILLEAKIRIHGKTLRMSHYPYRPTFWQRLKYRFNDLRFMDRRPQDMGEWLLHGHVHEKWKIRGKQINVGVDQWNFFPVSTSEIISLIDSVK